MPLSRNGGSDPLAQPENPATAPAPCGVRAGHRRYLQAVVAAAVVAGPLGFLVGGVLSPSIHESGAATIAANAAANPIGNTAHLAAFVLASYTLPVGAVGLAWLAYRRSPRLAAIGGTLAVLGWLPFSALTALDDLGAVMAGAPASAANAALLNQFTNDAVMNGYLIVYIVGHLLAYVLLGIGLGRAGAVPRWAAACLCASSPLTLAVFLLPGRPLVVGYAALALLLIGSLPAARALLHLRRPTALS